MNKENCALKLVDEIILYYDARSKKHQITIMSVHTYVSFNCKGKGLPVKCYAFTEGGPEVRPTHSKRQH